MNNEQEEGTRIVRERSGERSGRDSIVRERGRGEEGNSIFNTTTQDSTVGPSIKRSSSGLPIGIHSVSGDNGRQSMQRARELPTWLTKDGEALEQQFWQGFKKRSDRVFAELQKSDGWLIRDIFRFQNNAELKNFIECVQGDEHYRRGLLQICREDSHIHVVHDCNFSNGTCRCNWYKKAKTFGLDRRRDRNGSRRDSCRSRELGDVYRLMLYYATKGRTIIYQRINGEATRIPSEGYNLPESRSEGMYEPIREMEIQISGDGAELRTFDEIAFFDEPDERVSVKTPARKRRKICFQEKIQLQVVQVLNENPICPPEAIVKTSVWRSNPDLRFKDLTCREIKIAINSFKDDIVSWSMNDFQKMYTDPKCSPIFAAGYGDFDNYYYNVENSVNILRQLVEFQCGNDEDAITDFIHTLYAILERKEPKLNCMVVYSPPSAGKNFFFDCIKAYYINCGHLCNANKYNNFPFQDAEGRRLVFWNEPNYSPEFLEPIKEILGGDSTSVNVKYQHDTPVYRTPVIVTTNNVVSFMTHPAFVDRIKIFNWMPAPFLKDFGKKPNPLAVYHLFKSYDLV